MNNTCIVSSSWGSSKRMRRCCVGISHIRLCSDLNYWWKKSLAVGNTAALSSALCLAVDLGRLKPVHNVLWNSELAGCSLWGLQQFLPPTLRGNKRQLCEKKTKQNKKPTTYFPSPGSKRILDTLFFWPCTPIHLHVVFHNLTFGSGSKS